MSEIRFSNPPLNEVVLGVFFNAPEFSSVHYGLYWKEILERFPKLPVDRPVSGGEVLGLSFSPLPPLRRVWFESEDKKELVQLQSDRFYYNWRKQDGEDYPQFNRIYPRFQHEWSAFQDWWVKDSKELLPIQYEITYINQIDKAFGWSGPADHQKIFTFAGEAWGDFLKPPESHIFAMQFLLPDNLGSLSVNGNQGISSLNNEPVMVLELTVRSLDATTISLDNWFDLAHTCIIDSFLSLTKKTIQTQWGLHE